MSKLLGILAMVLAIHFPPGPAATFRYDGGVTLNDLQITPGLARTTEVHNADHTGICDAGGTKQFRKTTPAMKAAVYAEYGVDKNKVDRETFCREGVTCDANPKPPFYEIDHVEALTDGGADDIRNLMVQAYFAHPGAHEKDRLEVRLHKMICNGDISPEKAQQALASDWYAEYHQLFEEHPANEHESGVEPGIWRAE